MAEMSAVMAAPSIVRLFVEGDGRRKLEQPDQTLGSVSSRITVYAR